MIRLHRLDGTAFVLNADLIVTIERTPDTMLTLTTGSRLVVREAVEEVVERVISFRQRLLSGPLADDSIREN